MQASAPTLAVQSTGFLDCSARAHTHTHSPRRHAWTMPASSATQCQPVQPSACLCACRAVETTVDGVSARLGSGRVRLPRGGVGRGPGRANDALSQLRIGSSMQPRPRAAGKSRGCDEPRPPIGHAKRSVVARVRGGPDLAPAGANLPVAGLGRITPGRQKSQSRLFRVPPGAIVGHASGLMSSNWPKRLCLTF